MSEVSKTAMQLLERFEDFDSMPPTLKPVEQELIRQHLSQACWGMVWGIRVESSLPIGIILSLDVEGKAKLSRPGAIVGPYFLGEEYLPGGLGIYVPMSSEDLSQTQNF
jgi:hypothetical protein